MRVHLVAQYCSIIDLEMALMISIYSRLLILDHILGEDTH
jgi:hypothetical protein